MASWSTHISLEPPPILAYDGLDDELFARPARLLDVGPDGEQRFTRDDPDKGPSERLIRIWQERGDFSQLTAASIRAAAAGEANKDMKDAENQDNKAEGLSPQEMRDVQQQLLQQLALARGELTTALDLLSVLAAPTEPPTVDVEALPLPQQTLTIVPSVPPQPTASTSTSASDSTAGTAGVESSLPLASSLASLKDSAQSFFAASAPLLPLSSSPNFASTSTAASLSSTWTDLLRLHSTSAYPLIPLGALPGASFSGTGEIRIAREVGVFFGCVEAKPGWRRASVARVHEVREAVNAEDEEGKSKGKGKAARRGGRSMIIKVEIEGKEAETCVWCGAEREDRSVEEVLKERARAAFAEELFAVLSNEARSDAAVKSRLELGKRSEGDSVVTEGHGWTMTITMVGFPSAKLDAASKSTRSDSIPSLLQPLVRLLFLQEYARRRTISPPQPWVQPLLQTLSALLSHLHRLTSLRSILGSLSSTLIEVGIPTEVEFTPEADRVNSVLRLVQGEKELGGRVVLRAGPTAVFHVSHSILLPQAPSAAAATAAATHQILVLQAPKSPPVAISSVHQLHLFMKEQLDEIVRSATLANKLASEAKAESREKAGAMEGIETL